MFKTHFTDDELQWLSPYNEGDTMIFQSTNGDFDTSWIVQKIIYHANCNPIASHGTHRYHTGRIFYQNSKEKYKSGAKELISIQKYTDRTALFIFYLNEDFILNDINKNLSYSKLTEVEILNDGKVYVFSNLHPRSRPDDLEHLHWHEEYGIIKYITHRGIAWKRINLEWEVE